MRRSGRDLLLTDIERRIALREIVGFETLGAEALAAIANLSRRRAFAAGATVVRADEPRTTMPLLLGGDLHVVRAGRIWPSPRERRVMDLFWLARDSIPLEAQTLGGADILEFPLEGLEELLEEHFSIWLATTRTLASRLLLDGGSPNGLSDIHGDRGQPTLSGRIGAIADALPFARGYVDALLQLDEEAEEVRFGAGATVWQPGDPATSLLVLLDGALRGASEEVAAIGGLEVIANQPRATRLEALRPVVALRISEESLLDVLEDHHALARDLLALLAASVIRRIEVTLPAELPAF